MIKLDLLFGLFHISKRHFLTEYTAVMLKKYAYYHVFICNMNNRKNDESK